MNSFSNKIQDYAVLTLLGRGGFASVYKSRCLKTGIEVAIKMIDKKLMQDAGMVDRVLQEVEIHSRLKHPSILELYTAFEDANYVYLVLELCHNGELQQYLKKNTEYNVLTEDEARVVMQQVVEGLQYLHRHNILHRDMSLSNLLLTKDRQIKIADFGLATKLASPEEKHMTMCGTPNFISPEVASRGSHGLEADVWGLGCLLYSLLVGRPPFDSEAVKSTLTRVVMASYEMPAHLSSEAKDLIHRLLQKNPKDRIDLMIMLDHPFMKKQGMMLGGMTSHLTQDSGIMTMSSRRNSALSSGMQVDVQTRRTNSDCLNYGLFHGNNAHSANQNDYYQQKYSSADALWQSDQQRGTSGGGLLSQIQSQASSYLQQQNMMNVYGHPTDPGGGNDHQMLLPPSISSSSKPTYSRNFNDEAPTRFLQENRAFGSFANVAPVVSNKRKQKEGPIKLSSHRLVPTHHQTKNAILSILDGGEICLQFIKKQLGYSKEMVFEVCRISPDGERIIIYEPNGGRGVPPATTPPELPPQGTDQIFSFDGLPKKHWKKYIYAYQFVEVIRGKTPKVTYYTDKAKCILMDNLIDFQASFYEGGKVTWSANDELTLIDSSGASRKVQGVEQCRYLPSGLELMWTHARDSRNHCILLEQTLSKIPGPCNFPIVVGRKPSGKENQHVAQSVVPSFTMSMSNSTVPTSTQTSAAGCDNKVVNIPDVGTAVRLPEGQVRVNFPDGSQLGFDGKHAPQYVYPDGRMFNCTETVCIPSHVLEKLQLIPKVMKYMSASSNGNNNYKVRSIR
ncbi:PREDICTED: serine/threonine-protein kinase PLK4 [Nicrophorus vespilloides]|uniref:Serine/threonine-protein kinase SAK n=1 Tax=Nicrophorus vespilloides TaxID=110193 RepID=A0ABM1N227_NICVS|nr:PREDICTED: serine/threonine-protein kinase PLK4 [Nicrophorus vespilloides]